MPFQVYNQIIGLGGRGAPEQGNISLVSTNLNGKKTCDHCYVKSANRDNIEVVCFAWSDIREVRAAESQALATPKDTERQIALEGLQSLKAYEITHVPWSTRDSFVSELVA